MRYAVPTFICAAWAVLLCALLGACDNGGTGVKAGAVAEVTVAPPLDSLGVGHTVQLAAIARDAGGNSIEVPVSWTSSDSNVASVSGSGVVLGARLGTVTIRAESGGVSGTAVIVVDNRVGSARQVQFSTLLGGTRYEQVRDVCVDAQGNVYVVGGTEGGGFPTTSNAFQRNHNSGPAESAAIEPKDAFVTKFGPNGNLIWSTYLGGPNYDRAYAVEVDAQGFVYVAGRAGAGFPVTPGAFQPTFQGGVAAAFYGNQDGFVCKLRPDGASVVFCSYFGTTDPQIIRDLAIDGNGDIYVASGRSGGSYPAAVAGRFTNAPRGGEDAVVAKISGDGTAVLWATYLGGTGWDSSNNSVRVDAGGNPYVLFTTKSTGIATTGAYQSTLGGDEDVFVTRLNPSTGAVLWGTYLGGSRNESTETHELAVDATGNAYIAAPTTSPDFPTTPGALRRTYDGTLNEVFVSKISADGARLVASTFLGGSGNDRPEGIAVDAAGNVFLTGTTTSPEFPLTGDAHQKSLRGGRDAFGVVLSPDFSTLLYSSLFGGGGGDYGRGVAVSPGGDLIFGGETAAPGWPIVSAFQANFAGGTGDGFVVKVRP